MRFPFPDKLRPFPIFYFVVVLFVCELAGGTDLRFAALVSLFTLLFTGAFNQAGGLYFASGAFIFFNGTLTCLLGLAWKAVLFEPGESHLSRPLTTMLMYCGGMAAMWGAAWASKRMSPKRGFLSSIVSESNMKQSAIGCFVVGTLLAIGLTGNHANGSAAAALSETNRFPQFAIMLGTLYEIRKTNGRRALNWLVISQMLVLFGLGVVYTSKEGMFQGPVTWLLTAIAARFDFKPKLIIAVLALSFFMVYYMVPYSQYVRMYRDKENSRSANQVTALEWIFRLSEVRDLYKDQSETEDSYLRYPHLYNTSQGLLDRLAAISMDDALVDQTELGRVFGLYPTYFAIINTVPHVIWPNKPEFFSGNQYAREMDILSADDTTTGISFSIEADTFHQARWLGIFVVLPLLCLAYFLVNDSVVGSARDSPWPLLQIVLASHLGPESGVGGLCIQIVEGTIGIIFMAILIRYVFPMALRLVTGNERVLVRKAVVRPIGVGTPNFRLPTSEIGDQSNDATLNG